MPFDFDRVFGVLKRHKVPTLVFSTWSMVLVSYVVYQTFEDISAITAAAAGALATVFALPALVVGVLKWRSKPTNEVNPADTD